MPPRTLGILPRDPTTDVMVRERDALLFRILAKAKVVRTSDLVVLGLFPSLPVARRRLLRLHRAGYITGMVEGGLHLETRWTIANKGAEHL